MWREWWVCKNVKVIRLEEVSNEKEQPVLGYNKDEIMKRDQPVLGYNKDEIMKREQPVLGYNKGGIMKTEQPVLGYNKDEIMEREQFQNLNKLGERGAIQLSSHSLPDQEQKEPN